MARLVPTNGVLHGEEGVCPPLAFLTVEDDEAAGLIARGLALEYVEPEAVEPAAETETPATAGDEPSVGGGAQAAAEKPKGDKAAAEATDPAERLREIADHIELLGKADLESAGDRKGKPKLDVLSSALGYDVTAEDVDAAAALDA